jgi:predicted DNA-binding transcriptional regulator YafY
LRWGVERRLEFIESRLFWEGGVNRSDIVEEFGVSVPQASIDLSLYQQQAPRNVEYDRSQKRYFASATFKPNFITLDAGAYLEGLGARSADESLVAHIPDVERLPIPQRVIDARVLRPVLECARAQRSIEVLYQSMSANQPDPAWRRISPHAFANDGLRWHTRAYCHVDGKFKDFILSRCMDARAPDAQGAAANDDESWNSHFVVLLTPNPRLSEAQRHIIAQDFAMTDGEVGVPVRCALLYYFNKRLRLDVAGQLDDPREAPVVVKNRAAFDQALAEASK